jgi:CBS domain-containing protein
MRAQDIMTSNPACCSPESTVADAARMMRDTDCGCIPVVDPKTQRTVGVVTDRDLAIRAVAEGLAPDTPISRVMTRDVAAAQLDTGIDEIRHLMGERQIRRIPVVDADFMCVGIVAQADVARAVSSADVSADDVATVVQQISEPSARGAGRSRGAR